MDRKNENGWLIAVIAGGVLCFIAIYLHAWAQYHS